MPTLAEVAMELHTSELDVLAAARPGEDLPDGPVPVDTEITEEEAQRARDTLTARYARAQAVTERRWALERKHTKAQLLSMAFAGGLADYNSPSRWRKEEIALVVAEQQLQRETAEQRANLAPVIATLEAIAAENEHQEPAPAHEDPWDQLVAEQYAGGIQQWLGERLAEVQADVRPLGVVDGLHEQGRCVCCGHQLPNPTVFNRPAVPVLVFRDPPALEWGPPGLVGLCPRCAPGIADLIRAQFPGTDPTPEPGAVP